MSRYNNFPAQFMTAGQIFLLIYNVTNGINCSSEFLDLKPQYATSSIYFLMFKSMKLILPKNILDVIDLVLNREKFQLYGTSDPLCYIEARFRCIKFDSDQVYPSDSTEIAHAIADVLLRGNKFGDFILDRHLLDEVIDTSRLV